MLMEAGSKYRKPSEKKKNRKKGNGEPAEAAEKKKDLPTGGDKSQGVAKPAATSSTPTQKGKKSEEEVEGKSPLKKVEFNYERLSNAEKVNHHMTQLGKKQLNYFQPEEVKPAVEEPGTTQTNPAIELSSEAPADQPTSDHTKANLASANNSPNKTALTPPTHTTPKSSPAKKKSLLSSPNSRSPQYRSKPSPSSPSSSVMSDFGFDELNFDALPWEVEITRKVVKFFTNTKKYSPAYRMSAAQVIFKLAEGKRNPKHLSKSVSVSHSSSHSSQQKVNLYEAYINDSARILWEKAITFSAKLTTSSCAVYTQVIRVWEVIIDHDNLDRGIEHTAAQILRSYQRGEMSAVNYSLRLDAFQGDKGEKVRGKEVLDMPRIFTVQSSHLPALQEKLQNDMYQFSPAASTNDTEYNVTTFYSLDTMNAKSMIAGTNERRDYPFKEWQKENEIIKLNTKVAILLLGRSGTGKTTCCLYRLWNEFKNYWNPESATFEMKIPRKALISTVPYDRGELEEGEEEVVPGAYECFSEQVEDLDEGEGGLQQSHVIRSQISSTSSGDYQLVTSEEHLTGEDQPLEEEVAEAGPELSRMPSSSSISGGCVVLPSEDYLEETNFEEDLHQLFVTKNYVLCDQMKKRFYSMVAAYDYLSEHVDYEDAPFPNRLEDLNDLSYPAFLTARQFYLLLDNSLGDQDTFFERDQDGNIKAKIVSLDYDHEDLDILLDLVQSDSEDEDDEEALPGSGKQAATPQSKKKQCTEVTSLYFKDKVWPRISHQCGLSGKDCYDPMLVWIEIQSFIKGSELAIRKGRPLNRGEYLEVGNRMAPNFSGNREIIYKVYLKYESYKQNQRHSMVLFDECDLILHLHKRLSQTLDVPWSIHSMYIDEVQDFTQAELAIFIQCCRDPNSMFFTGDTAQSIMRGVSFRFQDLRSCFHKIHTKVKSIAVPDKPYKLDVNYRSHAAILLLASSVIDIIMEFFKDSIDHLPDDKGMFSGPSPVFLDISKEEDLSLLLSTNRRQSSAIEFGAHQAILVQSKEAKEQLPEILKGAIVLTIFEAKGLEFDDVLLYNFFTDSMVDKKDWRVITSFLEKECHQSKIVNKSPLPGSVKGARSRTFDPKLHKAINTELKYLYTAITRAKSNLWMYDSDKESRLPMLEYWYRRNVIKVVTADSGRDGEDYNLVFASNSTPEQWKAQGDNFKKKHLWDQAVLCYKRAGSEHVYLVKEALAYHYIQEASQQKPHLFLNAALCFLERDGLRHSTQCLNGAAICLKSSKPPRYQQAAFLFERLGEMNKAAQAFLKARDFDSFTRIKESMGEYESVVKILLNKPFMRKREALAKADEYEKKGCLLGPEYSTSELSFSCAKFYSERKDKKILLEVLQYMPEHEKKVKFLKEAELYKDAFKDYVANKEYTSAYRLADAQGLFAEARLAAEENSDPKTRARFILLEAKNTFVSSKKKTGDANEVSSDTDLMDRLKSVTLVKDMLLQAEANLLLGRFNRSLANCHMAQTQFRALRHKAGLVHTFNEIMELSTNNPSDQQILDNCHIAKKLSSTIRDRSELNIDVKETTKFCGLQIVGKVYTTSCHSKFWIEYDKLSSFVCTDDGGKDSDGMIRLEEGGVKQALSEYYGKFWEKWLNISHLESRLYQHSSNFRLHSQLMRYRYLNRQYSLQEVSALSLKEYIQTCVNILELKVLKGESTNSVMALLLALFSPQVSIYLPQCLSEQHLQVVRKSENFSSCFKDWIKENINKSVERVSINEWLFSWRASCIALSSLKYFLGEMEKLESRVNKEVNENSKYSPPVGFIYWKEDGCYKHVFMLWLLSCKEIKESTRPLVAAELVITHFLGNIAVNRNISITVMNLVEVLSIHTTSLLAMITQGNARQGITTTFTVPLLYRHIVQLFSSMNSRKGEKALLTACVDHMTSIPDQKLFQHFGRCRYLLLRAMDYLLGTHRNAPHFSMLNFGLQKFPKSDATKLCLILTLTLFGNLAMLRVRDLKMLSERIVTILKRADSKLAETETGPECKYIRNVYKRVSDHSNFSLPGHVFKIVENLLKEAQMDSTLSKLVFRQKGEHKGHIDFLSYHVSTPPQQQRGSSVNVQPDKDKAQPPPPVVGTSVDPDNSQKRTRVLQSSGTPDGHFQPVNPTPAHAWPLETNGQFQSVNQVQPQRTIRADGQFQPVNPPGQAQPLGANGRFQPMKQAQPLWADGQFKPMNPPGQPQPLGANGQFQPVNPPGQAQDGQFQPMNPLGKAQPLGADGPMHPSEQVQALGALGQFQPMNPPGQAQPLGGNGHPTGHAQPLGADGQFQPPVHVQLGVDGQFHPYFQSMSPPPGHMVQDPHFQSTNASYFQPMMTSPPPLPQDQDLSYLYQPQHAAQVESSADPPDVFYGQEFYYPDYGESYDDDDVGALEPEEAVGYSLTQQQEQPIPAVDPELVDEEIIDNQNSFCNVCGVSYRRDDLTELDNLGEEEPELSTATETYYSHVNGVDHYENATAYRKFVQATGEKSSESLLEMAGGKLTQCRFLKQATDTEKLDSVIDNLEEKIEKYNLTVTELKDSRRWREGIKAVTDMNEGLDRLLKEASDQYQQVANSVKQPRTALPVRYNSLEDEEEKDEIKEFSEKYKESLNDVKVKPKGSSTQLRSAEEKEQSREKKRKKKQQGGGASSSVY